MEKYGFYLVCVIFVALVFNRPISNYIFYLQRITLKNTSKINSRQEVSTQEFLVDSIDSNGTVRLISNDIENPVVYEIEVYNQITPMQSHVGRIETFTVFLLSVWLEDIGMIFYKFAEFEYDKFFTNSEIDECENLALLEFKKKNFPKGSRPINGFKSKDSFPRNISYEE